MAGVQEVETTVGKHDGLRKIFRSAADSRGFFEGEELGIFWGHVLQIFKKAFCLGPESLTDRSS